MPIFAYMCLTFAENCLITYIWLVIAAYLALIVKTGPKNLKKFI